MAGRELSLCGVASSANEAEARFCSKLRSGLIVKKDFKVLAPHPLQATTT
jgi:hypothetical protein